MNGTEPSPGQRARRCADDAGGRGLFEAERRADGQHVVADAQLVGVADPHHGKPLRVDLQHRDVGRLVRAQHLRFELATIGQLARSHARSVNDVRVGQDQPIRADDEARALPAHRGASPGPAVGMPRK